MTDVEQAGGHRQKGGEAARERATLNIATLGQPRRWRIGSAVVLRQMKREQRPTA
jgi:hypothetical protein